MMFNNLDVSNLLGKIERLHSEVCALRHASKLQADIGEDLRTVTETLGSRVAAMESRVEQSLGGGPGLGKTSNAATAASGCAPEGVLGSAMAGVSGVEPTIGDQSSATTASVSPCPGPTVRPEEIAALLNSPKWSDVAKKR